MVYYFYNLNKNHKVEYYDGDYDINNLYTSHKTWYKLIQDYDWNITDKIQFYPEYCKSLIFCYDNMNVFTMRLCPTCHNYSATGYMKFKYPCSCYDSDNLQLDY